MFAKRLIKKNFHRFAFHMENPNERNLFSMFNKDMLLSKRNINMTKISILIGLDNYIHKRQDAITKHSF